MSWLVKATNRFLRSYKRLHPSAVKAVDDAIEEIADNPSIGDKKKGDLSHIRVYKFRHQNQLYLLGYSLDKVIRIIYLEEIGSHENFYRDLKN